MMLFQELYKNPDLIGINIERNGSEFVVSVAYQVKNKWVAKTMSGFSGSFTNEFIYTTVVNRGQFLDETIANQIFSLAAKLDLEYESVHK